jgi:hypothetical protein
VEMICADDDASTRSLLRWSNASHMTSNNTDQVPMVPITRGPNIGKLQARPDKGSLPGHIPEPQFVADPNHRRKVLTGELYQLSLAKVSDKHTMTRMDAARIGKGFGYMIRSLPRKEESEYVASGLAVLEHHFDNHEYCGQWCPRKRQSLAAQAASNRYYRSKVNDAKLYAILQEKINRFITLDRLQEVGHGMDTQANESFNNTISWFAPKNKVYCASGSLSNRISLAIGINTLGFPVYFKRLFKLLGIQMTSNVRHFLQVKEKTRAKRLHKIKTKQHKMLRMQQKHEQLRLDEVIAKKERAKREGTYKSGMNMDAGGVDGYTEQDLLQQQARKKRRTDNSNSICRHCGLQGHSTTRSRSCLHYKGNHPATGPATGATVEQVPAEAQDYYKYDDFPIQEDPPSDVEVKALEEDAGNCDSDDDNFVAPPPAGKQRALL